MTRIYDFSGHEATVDIAQGSPEQYPLDEDPLTIRLSGGMVDDTITLSNGYDNGYTIGSNISVTGISVPWTTGTSVSNNSYTLDPSWNNSTSAKIQLDGPDADIEINGESLKDMLQNIEQRLNILKPNPNWESEWAELRALGDQYRALEKRIQEKQATWDRLKAMPPPEID
jgi:hypothetical protein